MMFIRAQPRSSGSDDPVVRWRFECLARIGLSPTVAARVAADPAYDLHAVLELVDRGCPADLAIRILAPLGEGRAE